MIPLGTILGGQAAAPTGFVDVLALAELPVGQQRSVWLGAERVLLCRLAQDAVHAVSDVCPHALQPLAGGAVEDGCIRCPKHGAQFDLRTGQPRNAVTPKTLRVFATRVRNGRIEVMAGPPSTKV